MVPVWKRVLDEIVRQPGLLDVDALARRAMPLPEPRRPLPYKTSAGRAAELAARAVEQERAAAHHVNARRRVTNACRELVRRGLVMPATQCSLEPETARLVRERGIKGLRSFSFGDGADPNRIVDGEEVTVHAKAIVQALLDGPMAPGELRACSGGLTAAGNPRGSWTSAWDGLVAELAVLPQRNRWPTLRGLQAASQEAREAGGRMVAAEAPRMQHKAS